MVSIWLCCEHYNYFTGWWGGAGATCDRIYEEPFTIALTAEVHKWAPIYKNVIMNEPLTPESFAIKKADILVKLEPTPGIRIHYPKGDVRRYGAALEDEAQKQLSLDLKRRRQQEKTELVFIELEDETHET